MEHNDIKSAATPWGGIHFSELPDTKVKVETGSEHGHQTPIDAGPIYIPSLGHPKLVSPINRLSRRKLTTSFGDRVEGVESPPIDYVAISHQWASNSRQATSRPGSDAGNSSLNLNARMKKSSLEERYPGSVVHGVARDRGVVNNKRTSDNMQDPSANFDSRPTKLHLTDTSRQAQGPLSRQNSASTFSRTRSPVQQRVSSPPLDSPLLASHYRNLSETAATIKSHAFKSWKSQPGSDLETSTLLKQPATRPISEAQLINEVKGIYAGLVMVEKKCVEIVAQQANSTKRLENQQWKALVALHRTLLQEHHDFFSASQHPTASDALKRLAVKYAMPARMWRHGIHAFLELLRHRLPDSMEHMLSFIYLAYSMMALLKESVPSFVETWIECLGDLARYRMAIEDSDPRDREIWSNVARTWYNEAADKSPNVGRIQHHLAVLARPQIVEQLFYYTKALTSVVPFVNARESIMLLFDMFNTKNSEAVQARYPPAESTFVHASAKLFTRGSIKEFYDMKTQFAHNLGAHMDRAGPRLKVQGPQIALALFASLVDHGRDDSTLWKLARNHMEALATLKSDAIEQGTFTASTDMALRYQQQREFFNTLSDETPVTRAPPPPPQTSDGCLASSPEVVACAGLLMFDAMSIMGSKMGDKNIVPFEHAILGSIWGLSFIPHALTYVEAYIAWGSIATFLNTIGRSGISYRNIESEEFPPSFGGFGKQLPEDFQMRGYITTQYYYPVDFFAGPLVDEDERTVELPSHQAPRAERCLWLGVRLASLGRWLSYDYETKQFASTTFGERLATSFA